MARILAVASAKGGVGKTTTAAALGTALAATGKRVVAVDTDLGMANLGTALGVDADEATVHDVLAGRADVPEATYEGPAGLSVVPGDTDLAAFPDAVPSNLRTVLDAFADADYVLLDTGAGLSHDTVLPLGLADEVLLVTDTDPNAVGDTEKTRQVVDRLGGSVAGVVVTQVDAEASSDDLPVDGIDAPVLATVPASSVVAEAVAAAEPLTADDSGGPVAAAYRRLARALTDEALPEPDVATAETADTEGADAVESDEREGELSDEAVPFAADSDAGTADGETLVPDAEDGAPTAADESTESPESPEGGVYTTSLVDEAEASGVSADESAEANADDGADEAVTEEATDDTTADDDGGGDGDGGRSGFLGRLLG